MSNGSAQPLSQPAPFPGQPQPQPFPGQPQPQSAYPPVTIILTIILLILFFVGFFSIYFCRCFMQNILNSWHLRHSPSGTQVGGNAENHGLDPSIVQSFPTFTYSSVKEYRSEKYGLECAICLVEFDGSDVLRLLTRCCHVFHKECIDLWLESHKTCPVCRRMLDTLPQSPMKSPPNAMHQNEHGAMDDRMVSIIIRDEDEEERTRTSEKGQRGFCRSDEQIDGSQSSGKVEKFTRSHSTGHSIVINTQDKFTLRLPVHVRTQIINGHHTSKSWTSFGDYKANHKTRNIDLAEASGVDKSNKV